MRIFPISLKEANAYVSQYHRHNKPVQGHKWSIGLYEEMQNEVIGVGIVGRPIDGAGGNIR